jgi:hypothetical protein
MYYYLFHSKKVSGHYSKWKITKQRVFHYFADLSRCFYTSKFLLSTNVVILMITLWPILSKDHWAVNLVKIASNKLPSSDRTNPDGNLIENNIRRNCTTLVASWSITLLTENLIKYTKKVNYSCHCHNLKLLPVQTFSFLGSIVRRLPLLNETGNFKDHISTFGNLFNSLVLGFDQVDTKDYLIPIKGSIRSIWPCLIVRS